MGKYRRLLLNTALFAANSVATKLVSFVLVPLYTAYMTAGEYGLTDMSLTVISLLTPLATLSIADAALRFMVGDPERSGEVAATSTGVTVASVAIVALLSPLLDLGAFGGLGDYKGWFLLAYATSALLNLCGNLARGRGEVKLIPICSAVSSLVTLASALALIGGMGMTVVGYFISVSVGPMVAIAVYLTLGGLGRLVISGFRGLARMSASALKSLWVPMLRYAVPLIPNSLFWWAQTSISRLFVTGMLGISASGMYAAASKVPNLLNTAYTIFQQAWQLSAFQQAGEGDVDRFYSQVFRALQAGMTVLCALLSLASPLIASLLLQGETYDAWPMIPVLLLANLMNVFNSFYGTVYTSTMHTSYIVKTTVVGGLVCVALTPALLPVLGTHGACVASAVSQGIVFALRARDSRRYIPFDAGWRFLAPTLVLLVVQAAVTALQVPGWQIASVVCLAVVVVLQGARMMPYARAALLAVRGRKQ